MNYIIDFSEVKTVWDLHMALKIGLRLPEYYGMNMDALWDCLTSSIIDPCKIYIKGFKCLPEKLNSNIQSMFELFEDAQNWYADINSEVIFIIVD